ncbi:hypothetical protein DFH05DRAFT_1395421, partial [Lentinula detonsa]
PALYDLPHDSFFTGSESSYYTVSTNLTRRPSRHWCLLAEIVGLQPWPMRPMYTAKDITGRTFLVSFHFDDRTLYPKVLKEGLVGSTICVMYADFHHFFDGQDGVRLEEPKSVTILPLGLEALITVSETVRAGQLTPQICAFCGGSALKKCSLCSTIPYCSQTCQTQAWKTKHKKECIVIRQMKKWNKFDWNRYDGHKGFESSVINSLFKPCALNLTLFQVSPENSDHTFCRSIVEQ